MSKALYRSLVITGIIVLSVIVGIIFQSLQNKAELKKYPKDYAEYVEKYSDEYGVPEYYVYGVIKYESSFVSNFVGKNGEIGLMGISETDYDEVSKILRDSSTKDALYGPETNIKYGTYLMSYLFTKYDNWDAVMLEKVSSYENVETLFNASKLLDENGALNTVTDENLKNELNKLKEICDKYKSLYYID